MTWNRKQSRSKCRFLIKFDTTGLCHQFNDFLLTKRRIAVSANVQIVGREGRIINWYPVFKFYEATRLAECYPVANYSCN